MTLLIKAEDLAGLIPLDSALAAVEAAYRTSAETPRLASTHTRLFHEGRRATFHPGGSMTDDAVGIFAHFERVEFGALTQDYHRVGRRFYAMYDTDTAELAAIILGSLPIFPFDMPTAFGTETAITSGVGTKLLARMDSRVLSIIGTGRQARRHLYTTDQQFDLSEIRIFSRDRNNVESFASEMGEWVRAPISLAGNCNEAVAGADIIICATASNVPVLDGKYLSIGAHVTSIVNGNRIAAAPGGPPSFRRELDDETLRRADVICAVLREQAVKDEQGDLFEPVSKNIISWNSISDLHEVLAASKPGRSSPDQITVFKQNSDQGVGFMALARLALNVARTQGIGLDV